MRPIKGYVEVTSAGSTHATYVRESAVDALRKVDRVVFDCDGVLLDVRESYDAAVVETVKRLAEALCGIDPGSVDVDAEGLFLVRGTGGFNNDWDLTFALTSYILGGLPEETKRQLMDLYTESLCYVDAFDRYRYIKKRVGAIRLGELDISVLADNLDSTGLESLGRYMNRRGQGRFHDAFRRVLAYPGGVGVSPLTTLFEEIFCGSQLYEEIYGLDPVFVRGGEGLIERGGIIPTRETLVRLMELTGGKGFGIASGSPRAQGEHVLGDLLHFFEPEASVWMDDVDAAMRKTEDLNLCKPDPYSLMRAVEALRPYGRALYVGDSQADLMMIERAGSADILFAGVYGCTGRPEMACTNFLEGGAHVVAASVNEFPDLFERLKEGVI